jgi:sulfur carrier protein
MEVTVTVAGEDTRAVDVDSDATYGDLVTAVGLNPHEASVLVDGRPVPADQPVEGEVEAVTVLRLIRGG